MIRILTSVTFAMAVIYSTLVYAAPTQRTTERPSDSRSVFIHGQVRVGGFIPWTDSLTLSQAIEAAGGLGPFAQLIYVYTARANGAEADSSRTKTTIRVHAYFKDDAIKSMKLAQGAEVDTEPVVD